MEGGLQEKVGFSDDKSGRGFGGWLASLVKRVAVSATLTFATPQAAYANPLGVSLFLHNAIYAKVGWQYPPTISLRPTSSTALLKGTSKNPYYCQIQQRKINNLTWLSTGF